MESVNSENSPLNVNVILAIVGGRDFNDYPRFVKIVDECLNFESMLPSTIVSGGAEGVDTFCS